VLKDLLPAATVDTALAGAASDPTALINLGGAYMQATAAMLTSAIQTELLAKGAQRVVVLNLPDLSKTPALNTQPDSAKAIVSAWAQAMNTKLQSDLGAEPKVLIVDFFGTLNGWVADKGSARIGLVSLSNVTERACGNTSAASCSEAALDTSGPGDWRTHLFADNLHATPFANQLTANHVQAQIKAKGWN
jgi:phospholipase/lecithinase/hemolysin